MHTGDDITVPAGHELAGIDRAGELCRCGARGPVLEHLAALLCSSL